MNDTNTICITGAGNGIGRAILVHFAGLGWRVIGLDIDSEALAQLRDTLPREQALLLTCDTGKEGEVSRAFDRIGEWLGDDGLDCLVNNSGISDPYCGPLDRLELSDWQSWIDASLTAAFLVSRASLPHLRRAGQASIANISSTRAVMSEPETFAYAAAKGGLDALTHSMAVTLGPDIRVNAIRPGWIETGPWQKRGAQPSRAPRQGPRATSRRTNREARRYRRSGRIFARCRLRNRAAPQYRWWHDGEDDLRALT